MPAQAGVLAGGTHSPNGDAGTKPCTTNAPRRIGSATGSLTMPATARPQSIPSGTTPGSRVLPVAGCGAHWGRHERCTGDDEAEREEAGADPEWARAERLVEDY